MLLSDGTRPGSIPADLTERSTLTCQHFFLPYRPLLVTERFNYVFLQSVLHLLFDFHFAFLAPLSIQNYKQPRKLDYSGDKNGVRVFPLEASSYNNSTQCKFIIAFSRRPSENKRSSTESNDGHIFFFDTHTMLIIFDLTFFFVVWSFFAASRKTIQRWHYRAFEVTFLFFR